MPSLGRGTRPTKEQAKRDHTDREHGILEKELMHGTSGRRDVGAKKGGKKGTKGSKPDWYGDKDKEGNKSKGKGKGKGKGKSESRYCYTCGEQLFFGVNCPYK